MKVNSKWAYIIKKIKIYLVFFCVLICFNCKNTNEDKNDIITIKNNERESVSFESSGKLDDITIVLENQPETPILGDWLTDGYYVTFTPLLPFTEGETYNIKHKEKVAYTFTVELESNKTPSELLAIYPTSDSVPENLLKMYFVFSKPMQEAGNSLDYITVYDNTINKEVSVFLELQSELWNRDHTVLTLWLDPGRVKTYLIPNQKMGLPINNGHNYTVTINSEWKDAMGQSLAKTYSKTLIVGVRDSIMPKTHQWNIKSPKENTKDPLIINFNEAMDYFLALECFTFLDAESKEIEGNFSLSNKETELYFHPTNNWKKGKYLISIETRLEDLAGNNLNHLFDTDLKTDNSSNQTGIHTSVGFVID